HAEREAIKRDQKVVELGVAHRERPGDIERGRKSGLEAGHEKKINPSRVGLKPVTSLARRPRKGCVHAKVPPMTAGCGKRQRSNRQGRARRRYGLASSRN